MKPAAINDATALPALIRRFLRYVAVDTQSSESSAASPSTEGQTRLLDMLYEELRALPGVQASRHPGGCVTALLPANKPDGASIGFIAHVDTSPDAPGSPVHPQLVKQYDGADIVLSADGRTVLSPDVYPELRGMAGETLIVTDGATLLGADDKAGVAEIMECLAYYAERPGLPHGDIRVAFTPDEEIGRGTDHFPLEEFAADFAFTVDGGALGELQYENFNAAAAHVAVAGRNIHPGDAKDKMLNAMTVAMQFDAALPAGERPQHTQGYEGFWHLVAMEGCVEHASLDYIVRDHDADRFARRKSLMQEAAARLNRQYGCEAVSVSLRDQYYNMKDSILPAYADRLELAKEAMRQAGVEPLVRPIRGGTDGAMLSCKGLPCPNLFAGGHNFHGRFEYIACGDMEKACSVLKSLVRCWAQAAFPKPQEPENV